jgi:hypothetical protein
MIKPDNPPPRMRGKEAAAYLESKWGIVRTFGTLAKLRSIGGGPVFQKCNSWPLYRPQDLDDWAEQILSPPMRSTSDNSVASSAGCPLPSR